MKERWIALSLAVVGLALVGSLAWLFGGSSVSTVNSEEVKGDKDSVIEKCQAEKTPEDQDACLLKNARDLKQEALCSLMKSAINQEQCLLDLATITGNNSLCFRATNPEKRDQCIAQIATEHRNPGLCQPVFSPKTKDECYADIAASVGAVELCGFVQDASRRSVCETRAKANQKSPN